MNEGQEYITSYRDLISYYSLDPAVADAEINNDGFLTILAKGLGITAIYFSDGAEEKSIEVNVAQREIPIYRDAGRIKRTYSPDYHRLSTSVNAQYDNERFFYNRQYYHSLDLNFPVKKAAWLRSQIFVRQTTGVGAYVDTVHIAYERSNFEAVLGDESISFGLFNSSLISGIVQRGLTLGFFPKKVDDFADLTESKLYLFGGIRVPTPGQPIIGTRDSEYGSGLNWQDSITEKFKYSIALGHFNLKNKRGHPLMVATSQEFTPTKELRFANTFTYVNGALGTFFEPALTLKNFSIYPFYYYVQAGLGSPYSNFSELNTRHRYGIQFRQFIRNKTIILTQGFRQTFDRPNPANNVGQGRDEQFYVGSLFKFKPNMELNVNYQFNQSKFRNTAGAFTTDNQGHYVNLFFHNQFDDKWRGFSSLNIGQIFSGTTANTTNIDLSLNTIRRTEDFLFSATLDYHRRSSGNTVNIYSPGVSFGYTTNLINLQYYLNWNLIDQAPISQYFLNSVLNTVFRPTRAHEFLLNIGTTIDMKDINNTLNGFFYINYTLNFGHAIGAKSLIRRFFRKIMPHKVLGSVFIDNNKNLEFDDGDRPLSNITVLHTGGQTETNKRGFYAINFDKNLPSGEVFVEPESLPEGHQFASKNRKYFVFSEKQTNYFGIPIWKETSQVDITVFDDLNGDGVYTYEVDVGVPYVPIIAVIDRKQEKKITDVTGVAYFIDVDAKEVTAGLDLEAMSPDIVTVGDEIEKTISITEPGYYTINLPVDVIRSINGKVFFDENESNNFDKGDSPAAGVRVSFGDSSSVTDADGNYAIRGIVPGEGTIHVSGSVKGRKLPAYLVNRKFNFGTGPKDEIVNIPLQ